MPEVITNKHGLSECWVDAAKNDPYEKGGADYSVTGILKPAQQACLQERHTYEVDVTDQIWSILGTAVHAILERMGGAEKGIITEQRVFKKIKLPNGKDVVLSGAIDRSENGKIKDFKITKVWAVTHGLKEDWKYQGNIYARLLNSIDIDVESIEIEALLKDWSIRDLAIAYKKGDYYPQTQIEVVPIPKLPAEEVDRFVVERIMIHEEAKQLPDWDLPECTEEERWCRDSRYIVKKKDSERALPKAGNFSSHADAAEFLEVRKDVDECEIVFREGVSKRCESYCPVKHLCHQYKNKINPKF